MGYFQLVLLSKIGKILSIDPSFYDWWDAFNWSFFLRLVGDFQLVLLSKIGGMLSIGPSF